MLNNKVVAELGVNPDAYEKNNFREYSRLIFQRKMQQPRQIGGFNLNKVICPMCKKELLLLDLKVV